MKIAREAKSTQTFRQKELLPDSTLESFIQKAPQGQFLFLGITLQSLLKELFPNYIGRIFQAKGQSKRVIKLVSYSVFFLKYFKKA